MKNVLMLSALVLSIAVVGLSNTAQANDRGHGYGGHSHSYSRPSYGYSNYGYSRPSNGFYYSQPGFSIGFGNSYPSYGYSNYGGGKAVREPRAVARFLYCNLQGLVLMGKSTQDRKMLEDVVRVTLSVLD